jgi:transcriptional regulator with XRE-family HTH domain
MNDRVYYKLLTADEVRDKLLDRRLSYVAEKCGLTYMSLSRIRKNNGKPALTTLEKLSEYFAEKE